MKFVAAVLAGGQSRRMGRDKATLVIDETTGETMGERVVRTLRDVCIEVVVLGHGRGLDPVIPRLDDAVPDTGPVGGILALLESGRGDAYVVCPVDMPLVEPAHLRALLDALAREEAAGAACFSVDGVAEPLPCAVRASAVHAFRAALARGERRLGVVLDGLAPRLIAGDQTTLRNINTFEEFETITGARRHR